MPKPLRPAPPPAPAKRYEHEKPTLKGMGQGLVAINPEEMANARDVAQHWMMKRGLDAPNMGAGYMKAQVGGYAPPSLSEDAEGGNRAYLEALYQLASKEGWQGKPGEIPDDQWVVKALQKKKMLPESEKYSIVPLAWDEDDELAKTGGNGGIRR